MKKIYLFLFPLFLLLFTFNVSADSFNKIEVAYGYDRGTSTGIWSGYSTTLSHNFGTTDSTIGYINTLNNIFTLNNQFQNGNFYSVNFTLQNDYSAYTSSFTLYDALQEMGHFNLKCSTSSSGSFLESEQCFTNYNVRFQKTAYDEVKAIITFTPLTNFTRLLLNITRDGSPTGSQLISEYFAFSNFSYTMSTGGTGEIIDNQNQNTQDIINNNNNNTQTIIDNQNQNTQQQIDSQLVCKTIDKSSIEINGKYLSSLGTLPLDDSYGITNYIKINKNTKIKMVSSTTSFGNSSLCFYNTNKSIISCIKNSNLVQNENINIPTYTEYVRFSIQTTYNKPQFEICTSGNQAIGDTITDSNIENGTGQSFFDDFTSQDFGLSQIITIPLNTIQSLTSQSCVPLEIPIPFTDEKVPLPCMTQVYEQNVPTIYNLWKIVSFGIVAYLIAVDIFHIVKGFKDPESDKVEVLDL